MLGIACADNIYILRGCDSTLTKVCSQDDIIGSSIVPDGEGFYSLSIRLDKEYVFENTFVGVAFGDEEDHYLVPTSSTVIPKNFSISNLTEEECKKIQEVFATKSGIYFK